MGALCTWLLLSGSPHDRRIKTEFGRGGVIFKTSGKIPHLITVKSLAASYRVFYSKIYVFLQCGESDKKLQSLG